MRPVDVTANVEFSTLSPEKIIKYFFYKKERRTVNSNEMLFFVFSQISRIGAKLLWGDTKYLFIIL